VLSGANHLVRDHLPEGNLRLTAGHPFDDVPGASCRSRHPDVAAYIVWMHCSHWRRATLGFRWVEDRAMDIAAEREWRP